MSSKVVDMRPGHSWRRVRAWILAGCFAAVSFACSSNPAGPSTTDLTGRLTGTGTYPNAPFQLTLTQTGSTLRGSYSDRHDTSTSVSGTLTGAAMTASVNFGDAQLHFEGT